MPCGRRHAGGRCDGCLGQFMVARSLNGSSCDNRRKIAAAASLERGGGSAIARRRVPRLGSAPGLGAGVVFLDRAALGVGWRVVFFRSRGAWGWVTCSY